MWKKVALVSGLVIVMGTGCKCEQKEATDNQTADSLRAVINTLQQEKEQCELELEQLKASAQAATEAPSATAPKASAPSPKVDEKEIEKSAQEIKRAQEQLSPKQIPQSVGKPAPVKVAPKPKSAEQNKM